LVVAASEEKESAPAAARSEARPNCRDKVMIFKGDGKCQPAGRLASLFAADSPQRKVGIAIF
jgi:hypothetical protein